ncbi:hypothetical protein [Desulfurobacterium atlanticum]|uniref:Uncharacterized protein n=1 Tax=Desulfurobacterium atlanticum TaxID=240169 RepID=A0A238ZBG4_9BACT|nr:hypothetical protein [Desulfurobacterium atlanticum]SNR80318.1 hypothetical protein SAMN06265340_10772 [Desulfurobacterium atlanticum]
MRKPATLLALLTTIGLILGWSIGTFFTGVSVAKVVASIPASPIVTNVTYNKEKHELTYEMLNPGGMPLTIVEESFIFTPGKNSKEKGYVLSNIPVKVVLAPGAVTKVVLKLKPGTEKLEIGDAVLATFTYVTPVTRDLYTIIHPFTMGEKTPKPNFSQKLKKEEGK